MFVNFLVVSVVVVVVIFGMQLNMHYKHICYNILHNRFECCTRKRKMIFFFFFWNKKLHSGKSVDNLLEKNSIYFRNLIDNLKYAALLRHRSNCASKTLNRASRQFCRNKFTVENSRSLKNSRQNIHFV